MHRCEIHFYPLSHVLWFSWLQECEIEYTRISYLSDLEVDTDIFFPQFMIYGYCKNMKIDYMSIRTLLYNISNLVDLEA